MGRLLGHNSGFWKVWRIRFRCRHKCSRSDENDECTQMGSNLKLDTMNIEIM